MFFKEKEKLQSTIKKVQGQENYKGQMAQSCTETQVQKSPEAILKLKTKQLPQSMYILQHPLVCCPSVYPPMYPTVTEYMDLLHSFHQALCTTGRCQAQVVKKLLV